MLRALSVSIMVFVMTSWSSSDEASSAQSQPLLCKRVASGVHVAIQILVPPMRRTVKTRF